MIKTKKDYENTVNLLDEIIYKEDSLLDILLFGKNPYNDIIKNYDNVNEKRQEEMMQEFSKKTSELYFKIGMKNLTKIKELISLLKIEKFEETENNIQDMLIKFTEIINEFLLTKKK